MISLVVIVDQIPRKRMRKLSLPDEDHPIQALLPRGTDNHSANAFKFGDLGGRRMTSIPPPDENPSECVRVLRVTIEKLAMQEALVDVGARDLCHR